MNKRISKLEKGENTKFEVTMANVSHANNLEDKENSSLKNEDSSNKYSESYWSEVI
jgi:hypothetical protein